MQPLAPAPAAPPVQAQPIPTEPAGPLSALDDPFEQMRPPAPAKADPDEFARKLQEALGPITNPGSNTGTA